MLASKINIYECKSSLMRIGPKSDGGYVVPKNIINQNNMLVSIGVGFDIRFEIDFYNRTKSDIIIVDKNIDIKDYKNSDLKGPRTLLRAFFNFFYLIINRRFTVQRKLISLSNSSDEIDLETLLENVQSSKNKILKIDIERYEYNFLNEKNISYFSENNFIAIIIEFHGLDEYHEKFLEIVNTFSRYGFYIAHLHGNNYTPFRERIGLYNCTELTIVNENSININSKIAKLYPLKDLDFPSNGRNDEKNYSVG
jgi:hypothetical protein